MEEQKELIKDKFKGKVQIETVRYYKDNWGILVCSVVETDKKYTKPITDNNGYITVKGAMPEPDKKLTYTLSANLVEDARWGKQYEITSFSSAITFDRGDKFGQKKFLQTIFADKWFKALYTLKDDPFTLLETENVEKLVQAKGIGIKTAIMLCDKFKQNYTLGRMMIELEQYHLTNNMLKKLLDNYKSADLAIDKVKSNPYILATEVNGIGWKKADEIAQEGGLGQYCPERVTAFILYYLEEQAQNGYNYISCDLLMDAIVDCIGEEVPDLVIAESIHGLGDRLWYDDDKTKIGLMKYRKLDENIARELLRIRDAKSNFNIDGWEEVVKEKEIRQGWEYTDQQKLGIETVLKNNVVMVTGKAGCVDCDTEFFNGTEWKRIADYKDGDMVLQYNADKSAELVYPLNYIKQPSDYLWHFKTKYGLDQCLSDEHNVYYITSKGNLHSKTFKEVRENHEKTGFLGRFITTFDYSGNGIDLSDDIIRLCIAFFADGSFYHNVTEKAKTYNKVRMHIKKDRKKIRLRKLLNKCNIPYEEKPSATEGYSDFYFFSPIGREKHFPKEWYNCSKHQFEIIADEVGYWDSGIKTKNGFSTVHKEDANFVQFVFTSLGYRTAINTYDRTGQTYKDKPQYVRKSVEYMVSYTNRKLIGLCTDRCADHTKTPINKYKTKDGFEYCFTVPSGMLVLRRNDKIFITGNCGKSTVADAMVDTLKDYSHALCALSGRAGARIAEITGEEGFTIHRLLGYPSRDKDAKNGFEYHDENPLPYDILIVDEVSMIGGYLFYHLLRAIKNGAKLVLLGDVAQLEAIGECKVAADIIESPEIPTVILDKIHRQAAKSAIITESLKVRDGIQIIPKDWAGCEIRGEMQDLLIDCYSDKSNTFFKVTEHFMKEMAEVNNIMDIQIICPVRNNGDASTYAINNAIQELYNPEDKNKNQIEVYNRGKVSYLREGDKVINTKNNYKTFDIDGEKCPIYNGNIGILREIDKNNGTYIIDFKDIGSIVLDNDQIKNIELGYAATGHKCVTEDTWVYTDQGLKQLKELNNGAEIGEQREFTDNVKVYNGSYFEQPSHFYNAGVSKCESIKTKRGYELTGTLEHGVDVLGEDGYISRKNIGELTENDYVLIRKGQNVFGNNTELPKEWFDLRPNIRAKIYKLPNEMTVEFAQFLGHMVADGTFTHGGVRYSKNQKETVKVVNDLIYKIFEYEGQVVKKYDGVMGGMYQTEIYSMYIREFLWNIDGIKPHNKYVPDCILSAPKEIQCAFLRGVFEDGSVNVKKGKFDHIELCLCGEKCIKQIQMMLLNLGIITSYCYTKTKKKNIHVLYIYKRDARIYEKLIGFESYNKKDNLKLCNITETHGSSRYMIPYISSIILRLSDKYNINLNQIELSFAWLKTRGTVSIDMLNLFLESTKEQLKDEPDYKYLESIANDYYVDSIKSIEDTEAHTYCLTMPKTHKFIQNGIQAWNCQGSQWKSIIIALDYSSYTLLSREWVYTAITRAQNKCILIAQNSALRFAISQEKLSEKTSHLVECLDELAHPKLTF